MAPRIGDGTGMSGGPEPEEADTALNDEVPNSNTAPYGQGSDGKGGELDSGGNYNSPGKG